MLSTKISAISNLTRWYDTIQFSLLLTLVAVLIADGWLGARFLIIFFANWFAVMFAFVINDIEDAPDDAQDPKKVLRNPISNKTLTVMEGYFILAILGIFSICLYGLLGSEIDSFWIPLIGISLLVVGFLYSYKPVRLKSTPVFDLLSHGYMLSFGLFLVTYIAFPFENTTTLFVAFGVFAFIYSVYGDVVNEVRDFEVDQKTGINNTIQLLKTKSKAVSALNAFTILLIVLVVILAYVVFNDNDSNLYQFNKLIDLSLVSFFLLYNTLLYFIYAILAQRKFIVRNIFNAIAQNTIISLLVFILLF